AFGRPLKTLSRVGGSTGAPSRPAGPINPKDHRSPPMRNALMAAAVACFVLAPTARAENLSLVPPGGRVADLVRVPAGAEMAYVAGLTADPITAGPPPRFGDTQAQTVNVLRKIQRLLESQGFSLEDVVMMRVALVGDPAKGGAMDFAGMNAGYAQFF